MPLKLSNLRNIISNNPRNIATIYFRLRGILKNTKLIENIDFHHFLRNGENEETDFHNENFIRSLEDLLKDGNNLVETIKNFLTKNQNVGVKIFIQTRMKNIMVLIL